VKRRGLFAIVALTFLASAAAAQVSGNATSSEQRDTAPDSPPKAPTYTPSEIFGPSVSTPASSPAIRDGAQGSPTASDGAQTSTVLRDGARAPHPSAAPAVAGASRTTPSTPPEQPPTQTCAGSSDGPGATDQSRQSQFPGVSASQFQRAGVGADAFTRPGVSTEQLRTLVPGRGTESCRPARDVVLFPEPATQRRVIPSAPFEP
jgi:hypothetical protein